MIRALLKYPKIIIGAFLIVIFLLLFAFSTLFKLGIMFVALFFIYKLFPPNYKKFSNFEMAVILTAGFIVLTFVGKGIGFLSVERTPAVVQPIIYQININPVILTLFFIIGTLLIMYLNKRKKR